VRTFKTMTADLLALGDWLASLDVTHVALESKQPSARRASFQSNPGSDSAPWAFKIT
jgi:hypothetical protein